MEGTTARRAHGALGEVANSKHYKCAAVEPKAHAFWTAARCIRLQQVFHQGKELQVK